MLSLTAISNAMKDLLDPDASVVTISISTTQMASESYGYMAPIKAALDSSLAFLAKSFSRFSRIRFNAVAPGLLKTSASAGIPGYVDAYLYAEQVIPRKQAVQTEEVANAAAFLFEPAFERHQRPADRGRCRHVDQLLRPRVDPAAHAAVTSEPHADAADEEIALGRADVEILVAHVALEAVEDHAGGRAEAKQTGVAERPPVDRGGKNPRFPRKEIAAVREVEAEVGPRRVVEPVGPQAQRNCTCGPWAKR